MDLSVTGLLIALLFLLPGVVWLQYRKRHFPMKRLDAAELLIEGLKYGTIVHSLMLVILGISYFAFERIQFVFKMKLNDFALSFNQITIQQIYFITFSTLIYTLLCCGMACALSFLGCHMTSSSERTRQMPVWLNFLNMKTENYLQVKMNDGSIFVGTLAIGPFVSEELDIENREFVLTDVYAANSESGNLERISPVSDGSLKDFVLINCKNVSSITLLRKTLIL